MGQPNIKIGSTGAAVSYLQHSLIKLGYKPGPIDGIFGPKTNTAVRSSQKSKGLVVDGIVGNKTWAAIDKATMYKPPVPLERLINSKNRASLTSYFIWIDLSHQRVNVFNGSNKKWKLVKSMVCSSGKASTPTIKGNFTVGSKGEYFIADSGAKCKYYTQIRRPLKNPWIFVREFNVRIKKDGLRSIFDLEPSFRSDLMLLMDITLCLSTLLA